jgi:hypothetical protein
MPGLVVAVILGASLLLVHFTLRSQPLPPKHPLNVDDHLPLPWLAQTSAVFSLTTLFGGYFGVAVALGLPALMGLACGTVLGLFIVRRWINSKLGDTPDERTFEYFLSRILEGDKANRTVYVLFIAVALCLYATSELLILRELAKVGLGLSSEQATLLAVMLAVVGYFYVLRGGYMALFRTDVVQLLQVGFMAIASSIFLIASQSQVGWTSRLWPRPGFWELPLLGSGGVLYVYHFIIGIITALWVLLPSPDTWKRVFQVNRTERKPVVRALTLVGVGILPYLVLFPVAITLSLNVDRSVRRSFTLPPALSDNRIFVAAALGLIASFLSSFNSAMLASVHLSLMLQRSTDREKIDSEELRFHVLMMVVLVFICLLFGAGVRLFSNPQWIGFTNPWVWGNMLTGAGAAITGVQIGTSGNISRLPKFCLQWILALAAVGWFIYFLNSPGFSPLPTIDCMNTVPAAVLVCLVTALLSKLSIMGGRIYARPSSNN